MRYRYYTCDVFTTTRFGGNPLAVLPDAAGLGARQMQAIAREFNLSETAFVFPPEAGHTRRVRIFTPVGELPFAGHPNVGTAFVLAATGALGELRGSLTVEFEEAAGVVPVAIEVEGGRPVSCELAAPQPLSLGKALPVPLVAAALSLPAEAIRTDGHPPQEASCGLPFPVVELVDRAALERASPSESGVLGLVAQGVRPALYVYVRSGDEFDLRARSFAPANEGREDPATGSAGCALAGLRGTLDLSAEGRRVYRIAQGVEMGRPSLLVARAERTSGVVRTWIGGACVMLGEGSLEMGEAETG